MSSDGEKKAGIQEAPIPDILAEYPEDLKDENQFEVFKKSEDAVDFRTVGWIRASVSFVKGMLSLLVGAGSFLIVT